MLASVVFYENRNEKNELRFPPYFKSRKLFPIEGYRPHLIVKGSEEFLGIRFTAFEKEMFGEMLLCSFEPLYQHIDYSALVPETPFWIMEGPNAVGEGVILEP